MPTFRISLTVISIISTVLAADNAFPFFPGFDISKVSALAESIPSHSWEFGTEAQALLELYDPDYSVFGSKPFPIPTLQKEVVKSLSYASKKIVLGDGGDGLSNGNGAVGDPASLGVSAVLLGKTNPAYSQAALETVDFIMTQAPRFWNGAISQRVSVKELWADFVYMAPPFLAYYAVASQNATLLRQTVDQCTLYRQILRADTTASYQGVWQHIIGPQSQDTGLWSTGNGWAAGGMARVLATVMKAPLDISWRDSATQTLSSYIKEILDGAIGSPTEQGLLRNYLNDQDGDGHGFGEVSGSAMLAAVAYRMAVLQPDTFGERYISWADGIRRVLGGKDSNGNPHVTSTGIVTPAVNPLDWKDTTPKTDGSPEGQAFAVLMYTAWRDCVLAGKCKNGGVSRRCSGRQTLLM